MYLSLKALVFAHARFQPVAMTVTVSDLSELHFLVAQSPQADNAMPGQEGSQSQRLPDGVLARHIQGSKLSRSAPRPVSSSGKTSTLETEKTSSVSTTATGRVE